MTVFYLKETSEKGGGGGGGGGTIALWESNVASLTATGSPGSLQEVCEAKPDPSDGSQDSAELGNALELTCLESVPLC